MLNIKYKNALSELYELLKVMKKEDVDKIPDELIDFIKSNRNKDYSPNFPKEPLKNLNLLPETKAILGFLYAKYWYKDDDDKKAFIELLKNNEF